MFRDLVSRCHYRPCRHVDIAPTSGLSDHLQAIGLLKAAGKAFEMEQSLTPDLVGASRSLVPRNTHTYVHTDALIAMIRARQQGSDGGAPLAPRRFESDSALGGFVCRLESGSFNASRPKKKERRREPPPKKTTAVLWCAIYAVLALRRTLPCVPLPVVLRLVLYVFWPCWCCAQHQAGPETGRIQHLEQQNRQQAAVVIELQDRVAALEQQAEERYA